ncbi:hypothetical protein PVAP13_1NG172076 [Panicum virgatum]|uniref:Uncharacterized protein n=1 Tax=Panicum virgatum TaxID=38727 RepID=A0A8T0WMZ4_PANVG|nr:hypothetical protein PVAP13_1NG172076 [Panicum virgatum]
MWPQVATRCLAALLSCSLLRRCPAQLAPSSPLSPRDVRARAGPLPPHAALAPPCRTSGHRSSSYFEPITRVPWPRRVELPALEAPPAATVLRRATSSTPLLVLRPGQGGSPHPHTGHACGHPCHRSPLLPPRRSLAVGQGASSGATAPQAAWVRAASTSRRGADKAPPRDDDGRTACRLDGGRAQASRGWQHGRARGRAAGDCAGGHEARTGAPGAAAKRLRGGGGPVPCAQGPHSKAGATRARPGW